MIETRGNHQMVQAKSRKEAVSMLEDGNILVYQPRGAKPVFLLLKAEDKITAFNENMRYTIHYEDLDELIGEYSLYVYEANHDGDVEIDEKFRNIRQ